LTGIHEKGLGANLLWLTEADYGTRDAKVAGLSPALWAQYNLDNFATVAEAVAAMLQATSRSRSSPRRCPARRKPPRICRSPM